MSAGENKPTKESFLEELRTYLMAGRLGAVCRRLKAVAAPENLRPGACQDCPVRSEYKTGECMPGLKYEHDLGKQNKKDVERFLAVVDAALTRTKIMISTKQLTFQFFEDM